MTTYRKIMLDEEEARKCAEIIQEHSWGMEYPINAWDELKFAEYIVGAFSEEKLIGCACVSRVASPDSVDNGKLWLADGVVLPAYRKRGIFKKLYDFCVDFLRGKNESVFACTDNPVVRNFLLERGWKYFRQTKDIDNSFCEIFVFKPSNNI